MRMMARFKTERVQVIKPGQIYAGQQGLTYGAGASAETVGAEHICMNVLPMPDGARAKVHYHRGIETIAYLLPTLTSLNWQRQPSLKSDQGQFDPASR